MRQDRDSETKVCACCGQEIAVRGRLSLSVDEAVLNQCNQAYDEALRRGSAQVEIAHLALCLAKAAHARLATLRVDHRALYASAEQWLAAHARRAGTGAVRASDEFKILLERAERSAAMRGAEFASIDDLVAALMRCASELSTASFVTRAADAASAAGGNRGFRDRDYSDRDYPTRRWPALDSAPIVDDDVDVDDIDDPPRRGGPVARQTATAERPRPLRSDLLCMDLESQRRDRASSRPVRIRADGDSHVEANRGSAAVTPEVLFERLEGLERAILAIERELGRLARSNTPADHVSTTSAAGREIADNRASAARSSGGSNASGNSASGNSPSSRSARRRSSLSRFRRRRRVHSHSSRQPVWRENDRVQTLPRRENERTAHPRLALAASAVQHEPEDADLGDQEDDAMLEGADASAGAREKRFYLALDDEVVRAPSIGPRTAERLGAAGIVLVRHLLSCDPERAARQLNNRFLSVARIRDFQAQARLVCTIPWLRGTHAQLLVGAGYRTLDDVVAADMEDVCSSVLRYAATREGQSVLRAGPPPSIERIAHWVRNASLAEPERAAA